MKDFLKGNGILILVAAVLLALITVVVTNALGGIANPLSNALYWLGTPARSVTATFVGWTEDMYNRTFNYDAMADEVDRLREELAAMEEAAREGEAASRENENLRDLLGLREKRKDLVLESATITAWGSSSWSSTFTISKGTSLDIALDDCVIDSMGNLVGIVIEVGSNWATVRSIIDAEIQLGGMVARTDSAAILEGDFSLMGENRLKLTYLPVGSDLMAGDQILTVSREGVYPTGLVVGYVEEIHNEASGMGQYAIIVPETTLTELEQVFVITDFDIVE